ncbi:MAG: hypothetical protein QOH21_543, partial [Acidobacteriota bacterium]|nr:hypothetical protein [Acidobacteriota bacterium]
MTAYREAASIPTLGSRLSALARLSTQLRGGLPTRQALTLIVETMPEIIPADAYAVWLFDERTRLWEVAASSGLSEQYAEHTIPGRRDEAALAHGPIRIDDAASAAGGERRAFYEQEGIASLFVIPLQVRGAATGTLTCYYRTRHAVPDEALPVASLLADAVGVALSARRFDRFAEAARSVAAELDVHKLVQTVTDAATELTNAQFGAFFYN